jgi:hypothetical protein
MPHLYVANATKQNQTVFYRLDFNIEGELDMSDRLRAARKFDLNPGQVKSVAGDMHDTQCKSIIEQLKTYGALDISETTRPPRNQQVPLIMSMGKPVPPKLILEINEHNQGVLAVGGEHRRSQAALATDRLVQDQVDATVKEFTVEIEDVGAGPGSEEMLGKDHKNLAVGYKIDKDSSSQQKPPKTRNNR